MKPFYVKFGKNRSLFDAIQSHLINLGATWSTSGKTLINFPERAIYIFYNNNILLHGRTIKESDGEEMSLDDLFALRRIDLEEPLVIEVGGKYMIKDGVYAGSEFILSESIGGSKSVSRDPIYSLVDISNGRSWDGAYYDIKEVFGGCEDRFKKI